MGRKSNKEDKSVYQEYRERLDLTREKASELMEFISPAKLEKIENGTAERTPQDGSLATYAPIMTKETGKIDFSLPAARVHDLVRGTDPWPGAYCVWNEKTLKICRTRVTEGRGKCGEVIRADKSGGITVACGEGAVRIEELQLQGKKRMSAKDFLNGNKLEPGTILM